MSRNLQGTSTLPPLWHSDRAWPRQRQYKSQVPDPRRKAQGQRARQRAECALKSAKGAYLAQAPSPHAALQARVRYSAKHLHGIARGAPDRIANLLLRAQSVKKRLEHEMIQKREYSGQMQTSGPANTSRCKSAQGVTAQAGDEQFGCTYLLVLGAERFLVS